MVRAAVDGGQPHGPLPGERSAHADGQRLPGGGLIRDSQKLLLPYVLCLALATGSGVVHAAAIRALVAISA